jgi:hypothetical protein
MTATYPPGEFHATYDAPELTCPRCGSHDLTEPHWNGYVTDATECRDCGSHMGAEAATPGTEVHEFIRHRAAAEPVFRECDARVLAAQIGPRTILAISGGRVHVRDTGVTLPVSNGYRVTVDLAGNDTYTVRRVFTRAGKTWVKGERVDVYAEQVSEVAYQASCFRNVEF